MKGSRRSSRGSDGGVKKTRSGKELIDPEKIPKKSSSTKSEAAKTPKDSSDTEKKLALKAESGASQLHNGEPSSAAARSGKTKLLKPTTPDEKTAKQRGRKRKRKMSKAEGEGESGAKKLPESSREGGEEEEEEEEEEEKDDSLDEPPSKRKSRRQESSSGTPPASASAAKNSTGPNIKRTCSNCGTLCENTRAKKCQKCKMFFYNHWAQRCRIPPCPKCHFNRKARGCTMLPKSCERCGHPLPGGSIGEGGELDSAMLDADSANGSPASAVKLEDDAEMADMAPELGIKLESPDPEQVGNGDGALKSDKVSETTDPVASDSNESTPEAAEEKNQCNNLEESSSQDHEKILSGGLVKSQDEVGGGFNEDESVTTDSKTAGVQQTLLDTADSNTDSKSVETKFSVTPSTCESDNQSKTFLSTDVSPQVGMPPHPSPSSEPCDPKPAESATHVEMGEGREGSGEVSEAAVTHGDGATIPEARAPEVGQDTGVTTPSKNSAQNVPSEATTVEESFDHTKAESVTTVTVQDAESAATTTESSEDASNKFVNLESVDAAAETGETVISTKTSSNTSFTTIQEIRADHEKVLSSDQEPSLPLSQPPPAPSATAATVAVPTSAAAASRTRDSDTLPQISEMMSNIENATTVIVGSSRELKKSLQAGGQDWKEDEREKEVTPGGSSDEGDIMEISEEANFGSDAACELKTDQSKDSVITKPENFSADGVKSHDSEPKSCDVLTEETSHDLSDTAFAAKSQVHVLGGPCLNTVMSVPLSHILSSLPPVTSVPILVPNNVAVTPLPVLSSTHFQQSSPGMMPANSTSSLAAAANINNNLNLSLTSGLAALMMTSAPATSDTMLPTSQMLGKGPLPSIAPAPLGVGPFSPPPLPPLMIPPAANLPPSAVKEAMAIVEQAKANLVRNQAQMALKGQSGSGNQSQSDSPIGAGGGVLPRPPQGLLPSGSASNSFGGSATSSAMGIGEALKVLTAFNTFGASAPTKSIPEHTFDSKPHPPPAPASVPDTSTPPPSSSSTPFSLASAKLTFSGSLPTVTQSKISTSAGMDSTPRSLGFPVSSSKSSALSSLPVASNPVSTTAKSQSDNTNFAHKMLVASISQRLDTSTPISTSSQAAPSSQAPPKSTSINLGPPYFSSSKFPMAISSTSQLTPALPVSKPIPISSKPNFPLTLPPSLPPLPVVPSKKQHSSRSGASPRSGSKSSGSKGAGSKSGGSKSNPKSSKPPKLVKIDSTSSSFASSQGGVEGVSAVAAGGDLEGGSSSAFKKLDFSSSTNSAQKIRVSLLKQNSVTSTKDESPSEVESSPSLSQDAISSAPLSSGGTKVVAKPVTPSSPAQLPGNGATTPSNGSGGSGMGKFQNFAVSPKLSVIATVETAGKCKGDGDTPTGEVGGAGPDNVTTGVRGDNLSAIGDACPEWSIISATGSLVAKDENLPKTGGSSDQNTIAGVSSETLKIQARSSRESPESSAKVAPSPPSLAAPLINTVPSSRPSFRKILPNLTKSSSSGQLSLSIVSTSPVSHIRTPGVGVVTVQVCSTIPSSLTLSSITNPSVASTNGGIVSGGVSPGGVALSGGAVGLGSDVSAVLDAKKVMAAGGVPGIIKPRGVVAGGGNVMVTPLSPTMIPAGRTVAQIVTSKSTTIKDELLKPLENKIASRTRSKERSGEGVNLMSEECLNSSLDSSEQTSEASSGSKDKKRSSTSKGCGQGGEQKEGGAGEDSEDEEGGEGEWKKGRTEEGDDASKDKKRRRSGKKKKLSDMLLYSVKLKDCFMHHVLWTEHRVVLIVPIIQPPASKSDITTRSRTTAEGPSSSTSAIAAALGAQGGGDSSGGSGSEKRRRRKPKLETLQDNDEELDEVMESATTSPNTSSGHIRVPCFSMYELRHKHFSKMTSNAVYAYTYKHQIKSLKTPSHWVQVMRRMGGVQEHGYTSRLINVRHVKEMCQQFDMVEQVPSNLDALCRNDIPKTRILIDLSQFTPDQLLEADRLDVIPICPFIDPAFTSVEDPAQVKKPRKTERRKKMFVHRKRRSHNRDDPDYGKRSGKKSEAISRKKSFGDQSCDLSGDEEAPGGGDIGGVASWEQSEEGVSREQSRHNSLIEGSRENSQSDSEGEEGEEVWSDEGEAGGEGAHLMPPPSKRPAFNIKNAIRSSRVDKKPLKKKHCPQCFAPIARKCKKCPACGKRFGVFTFGRKLCPSCGRINLARMANCFQCGHPMINAEKAVPKHELDGDSKGPKVERMGSVFGARKKRLPPLSSSGDTSHAGLYGMEYSSKGHKMKKNHYQQMADAAPVSASMESSRHNSIGEGEGSIEGANDLGGMNYDPPAAFAEENKTGREAVEGATTKTKQSGYQYGRIPWNEADITCIVDNKSVAKFCLNELCTKVLLNHAKGDVFDMVKNLNLPVEHGGGALLKKLQALGLHSNRSPKCKLIASEELWTLLDALREPVPEEVYQHLEHIATSSTPLLSPQNAGNQGNPALPSGGLQSPGLVPSGTAAALLEDDEHGFQSTLHEVECSDGQSVSILRAFNGEQYACVTEFWRKYFPEVNRNHLTSALKRLALETIMPTGQQATLLRSAGVISLRGAAGRLMRFQDMEKLMDDFGIPLQIGKPTNKTGFTSKSTSLGSGGGVTGGGPPTLHAQQKISMRRPSMRGYAATANHMTSTQRQHPYVPVPHGKVLMSKDDVIYAQCMRNVMASIDPNDLRALLVKSRDSALASSGGMDTATAGVKSELDSIQQLIHARRTLCSVLTDDISYLTMSNHGYMTESVRMDHTQRQVLKDVQALLNTFKITLNSTPVSPPAPPPLRHDNEPPVP